MSYIYRAMGWILEQLYSLLDKINMGNYALAIVLFTILVNVVFLPLSIKQQKSMSKQAALRPRLEALKEKCGDDRQRYQTEMQALYQKENVSMMGGCWTLLVRLPFLWGVWQAIRMPLSYILNADEGLIAKATKALATMLGKEENAITELDIVEKIGDLVKNDATLAPLQQDISSLNFNFFGINLTETPTFGLDFAFITQSLIWLIPLLSFATAMLSSVVTMRMQKHTNPQQGNTGCMMLMMPLLSLWIAFTVPGAVGFYWACSNVANMIIQIFMQQFYGPYKMIAREESKLIAARKAKEKELRSKEV